MTLPSPLPPPNALPDPDSGALDCNAVIAEVASNRPLNEASKKSNRPARKLVREDDFVAIGVRYNESRVSIIRGAVHQAATDLADRLQTNPAPDHDQEMARLVIATYRVLDPRARRNRHQSAMVGRILPNALNHAAGEPWRHVGEISPVTKRSSDNAFVRSEPAFSRGRTEPVADSANDPASTPNRKTSDPTPITLEMFSAAVMASDFNAMEVEEFVDQPTTRSIEQIASALLYRFRRWSHQPRVVVGLTFAVTTAAFLLTIWTVRFQQSRVIVYQRNVPVDVDLSPKVAEPVLPQHRRAVDLDAELAEFRVTRDTTPKISASPRSTPPTTKPLVAITGEIMPEIDPVDSVSTTIQKFEDLTPKPAIDGPTVPAEETAEEAFSSEQLIDQENDLWEQTEAVRQRFTIASAAALISDWESLAETASHGNVKHAASKSLCLRAAWLVEDWSTILRRARALDLSSENELTANAKRKVDWNLSRLMAERLVASWSAARANVDRTEDFNQLLRGANRVIDALICSGHNHWPAPWIADVSRLTDFATDEKSVQHWQELTRSFEKADSIVQQKMLHDGPSSAIALGRVLCLQQRRWDEGLPSLARSADRMLSSIARAELSTWEESLYDQDPARFLGIAKRWHHAAAQYETREAASLRLHALDLIEQSMQTHNSMDAIQLREECLAALPDYVH